MRSTNHWPWCVWVVAAAGLAVAGAGRAAAAAADGGQPNGGKPNVLFFFTDDQRADTIAALGNPVIRTPNLDRLCRRGPGVHPGLHAGRVQRAPPACRRGRCCCPASRCSAWTTNLLRDETWPAAFGRAGYTTFMSGKWHNGAKSLPASFQIARSVFAGGMTNPLKAPLMQPGRRPAEQAAGGGETRLRGVRRRGDPVPPRAPRRAVLLLRAVRRAARSAHRAGRFPGPLRSRQDPAAAELPAAASVRQRRDEDPRRGAAAAPAARRRPCAR